MPDRVRVTTDGPVATVTLNRPEALSGAPVPPPAMPADALEAAPGRYVLQP